MQKFLKTAIYLYISLHGFTSTTVIMREPLRLVLKTGECLVFLLIIHVLPVEHVHSYETFQLGESCDNNTRLVGSYRAINYSHYAYTLEGQTHVCDMCIPGYRVKNHCTNSSRHHGPDCRVCPEGTYSNWTWECRCKNCTDRPSEQHILYSKCTSTQDAVWITVIETWGPWSQWSLCSVSCSSGVKTRQRNCTQLRHTGSRNNCQGISTDMLPCYRHECSAPNFGPYFDKFPLALVIGIPCLSTLILCIRRVICSIKNSKQSHTKKKIAFNCINCCNKNDEQQFTESATCGQDIQPYSIFFSVPTENVSLTNQSQDLCQPDCDLSHNTHCTINLHPEPRKETWTCQTLVPPVSSFPEHSINNTFSYPLSCAESSDEETTGGYAMADLDISCPLNTKSKGLKQYPRYSRTENEVSNLSSDEETTGGYAMSDLDVSHPLNTGRKGTKPCLNTRDRYYQTKNDEVSTLSSDEETSGGYAMADLDISNPLNTKSKGAKLYLKRYTQMENKVSNLSSDEETTGGYAMADLDISPLNTGSKGVKQYTLTKNEMSYLSPNEETTGGYATSDSGINSPSNMEKEYGEYIHTGSYPLSSRQDCVKHCMHPTSCYILVPVPAPSRLDSVLTGQNSNDMLLDYTTTQPDKGKIPRNKVENKKYEQLQKTESESALEPYTPLLISEQTLPKVL
ncbi:uncharacterized protein LOC112042432 [Lingula anatina]|uniref:Uncharacterized protein LOC112042432 n=1 Tax=Lingula anatina TaxID=7574 RepID=A0A2R2MRG2_LINAN|nr:uncharacterized protein LOC112042432 [Lingula anatina]|eukprot:XP_023932733.1 uncharacterized protein LOC112042432 [Lingula anatina]